MKIESDPSPHKRYHVMRDEPGAEVLASFDTIEEAKTHVEAMRHDWALCNKGVREKDCVAAKATYANLMAHDRGGGSRRLASARPNGDAGADISELSKIAATSK